MTKLTFSYKLSNNSNKSNGEVKHRQTGVTSSEKSRRFDVVKKIQ